MTPSPRESLPVVGGPAEVADSGLRLALFLYGMACSEEGKVWQSVHNGPATVEDGTAANLKSKAALEKVEAAILAAIRSARGEERERCAVKCASIAAGYDRHVRAPY